MSEWQQAGEGKWVRDYGDGATAEVSPGSPRGYQLETRYPRDWRMWGLRAGYDSAEVAQRRAEEDYGLKAAARRRWVEACRTDGMQREGGRAVIVQHCAVFGRIETQVRDFRVGYVLPHAQHAVSVDVSFTEPRKRNGACYTMRPDNLRYVTIEVGGRAVYDSRVDVPCDQAEWEETAARFLRTPATTINGVRPHAGAQWEPVSVFRSILKP